MKNKLIIFFITLSLFIITATSIFAQDENAGEKENDKKEETKEEETKKEKWDEKKLQFGIGIHINSLNFSGMSEAYNIFQSIKNDEDYTYPGISDDQEDSIQNLPFSMQKDLLAEYIFKNQEYGIHLRLLWNVIIFETNFDILPMDYSNNERSNFMIAPMIGLRYPGFIMPYLMVGPNFNIGYQVSDEGSWQDKMNSTKNSLIFSPGLILKTGLDFKFQHFSFGLYYQYRMKDFNELTYWYSLFKEGDITNTDAAWNIIASQSRIGLHFSIYFSKKNKKQEN